MASDGYYRSRRMADWIATVRPADDRVCMLQCEQRVVGDLGTLRRRVCIDRIAGFSFPDEPSRFQEELKPQRAIISRRALLIEEHWTPPRTLKCSITFLSIP